MSLKWFHAFFIGTSILLTIVLAAWAIEQAHWLLAIGLLAAGAGMVMYRRVFLQRTRELRD